MALTIYRDNIQTNGVFKADTADIKDTLYEV